MSYLDIYYSNEDLQRRVSGYEILEDFRSLSLEPMSLPAMVLWTSSLKNSCAISLEHLFHQEIFDLVKLVVQCIKHEQTLSEICVIARDFVASKSSVPVPKLTLNVKGDYVMGDNIEVSLGDNASIDTFIVANSIKESFNKAASATIPDDLKNLLKDLSMAVGKMSEKLTKTEAEQVARDLETLIIEATSKSPRRKWWN